MPPDDPLGRHGPTLAQFLSNGILTISSQLCPYARKCTYGNKCKFYHPERPNGVHVSVTERLIKDRQQRTLLACPSQLADVSSTSSSTDRVGISRTQSLNIPFHDGLWSQHSFNEPIPVGPQKLRLNMHPKNMMQQQQQQHGQQRQVNQHLTAIRAAHPELYQHANLDRQFSAPSTAGNRPRLIATTQPPLTPLSAPLLDTPTNQFFYDQPQIPPHHHLYRNSFAHCNPSSCPTVNNDTHLDGYNNGGTKYMATNMFFSDEAYQSQENKSSHLFSPSTAVWGESKLSVGPLMRSAINVEPVQQQSPSMCNIANRDHLRTLLSQLFPERVVLAVLDANPNETDPRKLCAQIVEQQKRFGN